MPSTPPDPLAWNDALLRDPHQVRDKRQRVQKMFAAIAPSYDLNNRLHSLWMDQRWRRQAVELAQLEPTDIVVDVACGTGDLTIAFASALKTSQVVDEDRWKDKNGPPWPAVIANIRDQEPLPPTPPYPGPRGSNPQVVGIDFTYEMLPLAREKSKREGAFTWQNKVQRLVRYLNGDAQSLPLRNQSADVVSIAFGIRNVQDPAAAIREFHRVLRPGGRLIILEFSLPTNAVLRGMYNFYFRQVLPRTATLISGDKTGAYKYLPESVNTFIGRKEMMGMMREAGFADVEQFPMTFGVCVCYRGFKQ